MIPWTVRPQIADRAERHREAGREPAEADWRRLLDALVLVAAHPAAP